MKGLDTWVLSFVAGNCKCLIFENIYILLFSLILGTGITCRFHDPCLTRNFKGTRCLFSTYRWFWFTDAALVDQNLWATYVHCFALSRLGHYRSWIIPTQLSSVFILVILLIFPIQVLDQPSYLFIFFVLLFLMNFSRVIQTLRQML